jgi:hypothetical protein
MISSGQLLQCKRRLRQLGARIRARPPAPSLVHPDLAPDVRFVPYWALILEFVLSVADLCQPEHLPGRPG